jgi:signal transduction histidine kinase
MTPLDKTSLSFRLPFFNVASLKIRLEWFIHLRWIAVFGVLASIPIGQEMLDFQIAYPQILVIASILLSVNLVYYFILHYRPFRTEVQEVIFAEIQVIADLLIISFLIHYAGGIHNPFFFLYIVQLIFSGILFPGALLPLLNAILASLLLTIWTILEFTGVVEQYLLWPQPISFPLLITALVAFYFTTFASIYIIHHFMARYNTVKKQIDEKNQLLQRSIQERREIFRYAAHELKSPITVIKSTFELVRKHYADVLDNELYSMILRGEKRSEQVLNMVNEMIEITRFSMGALKYSLEKKDFGEWLKVILDTMRSYAKNQGVELTLDPLENHRRYVYIDTVNMEKVLRNLVNNAIRYTPSGGHVWVRPFIKRSQYGFSVKDTGIGIAKEDREKIFNEFYRTGRAKSMERIGTGLGLNLVKEVVTRNGGEIKVESEQDQGSTFTIVMPHRKPDMTF